VLTERLNAGTWFGFSEVDMEIPKPMWLKFEEMPPFFFTKQILDKAVSQHIKEYLERIGRKRGVGEKLVRALSVQKLLLYAPLLRWYVEHGAVIKAVHRTIDYQATKIFSWFVGQATETRRTGDVDKSKALLAGMFKLLGNRGYGKLIEALEHQACVVYTMDEKVLREACISCVLALGTGYLRR